MNDPTVTIHSKDGCPYCEDAKAFLFQHGIPFDEIKHNDDAERQALYDSLGLAGSERTVPQVMLRDMDRDYLIGGAQKLRVSRIETLFTPRVQHPSPDL